MRPRTMFYYCFTIFLYFQCFHVFERLGVLPWPDDYNSSLRCWGNGPVRVVGATLVPVTFKFGVPRKGLGYLGDLPPWHSWTEGPQLAAGNPRARSTRARGSS